MIMNDEYVWTETVVILIYCPDFPARPFIAEVKNAWNFISTPYFSMAWCLCTETTLLWGVALSREVKSTGA
jgi:hypothetical protein